MKEAPPLHHPQSTERDPDTGKLKEEKPAKPETNQPKQQPKGVPS